MIEEEFRPEEKQSLKKKFKIRKTLASMIRQRGYFHPQQQLSENETWEEFEAKYRSDNVPGEYIFFKNGDDTKRLLIRFYTKQGPLTLDDAKKTMSDVQRYQVNTIIMVFPSDPYAAKPIMVDKKARLWIEQVNSIGQEYSFELFGEDDLVYDVTKHELVPQHIILSTEEKKQLLVKYRVNENQLPRILQTDPISKFLGLHHGDVVKIIRKSETAGLYVTYRIVM